MSEARPKSKQPQQRVFKGDIKICSDLYRLRVAETIKNESWNDKKPIWVPLEHAHIFRTYDSDGRAHTRCNAVAGHFHEMEIIQQGPDQPPIVKCGPPVKEVIKFIDGEPVRQIVPVHEKDKHTHEVHYERSDEIKSRTISAEAAKLLGIEASKGQVPPEYRDSLKI
jgi:hypothetical protein